MEEQLEVIREHSVLPIYCLQRGSHKVLMRNLNSSVNGSGLHN